MEEHEQAFRKAVGTAWVLDSFARLNILAENLGDLRFGFSHPTKLPNGLEVPYRVLVSGENADHVKAVTEVLNEGLAKNAAYSSKFKTLVMEVTPDVMEKLRKKYGVGERR